MTAPDQLQNVKINLANREPSTHDPERTSNGLRTFSAVSFDGLRGYPCYRVIGPVAQLL
jgi:hypothetical protein